MTGIGLPSTRESVSRTVLTWELFDLAADTGEKTNVAEKHPDVVKKVEAEYDAWWAFLPPFLVNEDAVQPKENTFKELYRKQFGLP